VSLSGISFTKFKTCKNTTDIRDTDKIQHSAVTLKLHGGYITEIYSKPTAPLVLNNFSLVFLYLQHILACRAKLF
jgi:hypothetical protein